MVKLYTSITATFLFFPSTATTTAKFVLFSPHHHHHRHRNSHISFVTPPPTPPPPPNFHCFLTTTTATAMHISIFFLPDRLFRWPVSSFLHLYLILLILALVWPSWPGFSPSGRTTIKMWWWWWW